jgi:hypothetical protein
LRCQRTPAGKRSLLFGKEARLACCQGCHRGFAARDSHDAKDGHFREGSAGNEDAIGCRVEVGRSDLQAVVEYGQQVVGNDTFKCVIVREAEADPKTVELGTAEKGFAFWLEIIGKLADKVNSADSSQRNLHVLAVRSEDVDGIGLAESRRTEIAAQGCLVQERDDNFLVRRGWGSVLQRKRTRENGQICETSKCMLC